MTEERKKYLDSISKEEQAIREHLYLLKCNITWYKRFLCVDKLDKCAKEDIRFTKTIIKALKKQLPAPMREGYYCNCCPICGMQVNEDYDKYCYDCGQKLR